MRKNLLFVTKALVFCMIFLAIFFPLQQLLALKSLAKPWDMTNKITGFYNEPEDEFSVMFFGSSHAYASFSPLEIWKETGIKSYAFATQLQPMWATTTYLKEALKTQHPDLVILECYRLCETEAYTDEAVTHSYMDDIPLSLNKLQLAQASAPREERLPLVANLVKYHDRWSCLEENDWQFRKKDAHDPYKGFVMLPPNPAAEDIIPYPMTEAEEATPLSEKTTAALEEFLTLCEKEDIDVWMVTSPCNMTPADKAYLPSIAAIAEAHGIPFDDYNSQAFYQEIGLVAEQTFFDQNHMDIVGATRFNHYFAKELARRYPDLPQDSENVEWQQAYDAYQAERQSLAP